MESRNLSPASPLHGTRATQKTSLAQKMLNGVEGKETRLIHHRVHYEVTQQCGQRLVEPCREKWTTLQRQIFTSIRSNNILRGTLKPLGFMI